MISQELPIVVVGAGPVGLAVAAHLVERGLRPLLLEADRSVAASIRDWGHVRLFSPWRFNVDKSSERLLKAHGWTGPPADELPSGQDLYEKYLSPLAQALAPYLRLDRRVTAMTRRGVDKVHTAAREQSSFLVRTQTSGGAIEDVEARAVIDATGTWSQPNPLGGGGVPARGEDSLRELVHYGIPDILGKSRGSYAGKTTMVVGAGHSAANSIIGLAELANHEPSTSIVWATRGDNLTRVFGGGEGDALPARGKLGTELLSLVNRGRLSLIRNFQIEALEMNSDQLAVSGTRHGEPFTQRGIDRLIAATGQRPDLSINRELRLALDPALESVLALGPLIDPNLHSCGTVRPHGAIELAHPEPDFYIIGSKSYGRAPTFLLATGYEQARSVAAMLADDREAAMRVELDLPETGVCLSKREAEESACCAPEKPSRASATACC